MSKILAVFGATGQQGGSVISYVLNDPKLSQEYKIRAITRNVTSEKAKQPKEKVEVVYGDVLDRISLEKALADSHTVFAMTPPSFSPEGLESTLYQGSMRSRAASTPKSPPSTPRPKLRSIFGAFQSRLKSAFFAPGSFMENFQYYAFWAPHEAMDGTWVMAQNNSTKTQLPLIDAVGDTGKFVGAILAEPNKYEGKTFCAATALYSLEEIAAIISKVTGKPVVYKQIPLEDFKKSAPFGADLFAEFFSYQEEFGYYGPDSEKLVAWAAENARGKLSTFEEYLEAHPLQIA
ncbi:hypothetical protein F5B20DRAFT_591785 [Whalleya microplaca]|nr:hypothetical protein F5B20DRAFT_591785 [Whalleya microplaca]